MSSRKQTWASAHSQLWTSPGARSGGSKTQSEVSSIASQNRDRSLLDDGEGYDHLSSALSAPDAKRPAYQPKDSTLVQVSDILEGYGTIMCDADIPTVLLDVVKELERVKRDNNFKDLLLREYSDAVQRRFFLYGEEHPPSVTEVSTRLRNAPAAGSVVAPNPVWIEGLLNDLRPVVSAGSEVCFGKTVELPVPVLLPDAKRTKANLSQLLQTARRELSTLIDEYTNARNVAVQKLEAASGDHKGCGHLSLTAVLAELEAQNELKNVSVAEGATATTAGTPTIAAAIQGVIDVIPASLQIYFNVQTPDAPVVDRCSHLAELVRFLTSEYLSMEKYMEGVEAQRCKLADVFRLPIPSTSNCDDTDDVQLNDALSRSLRTLQSTVTAVATFPHHISEGEVALRRKSTQAVNELAQLFVATRQSGSGTATAVSPSASAVRVEPPTHDLLEMVELIKSRFATLTTQQQRREMLGSQGRMVLTHMEDSMAKYGKQVIQLLQDLCSAPEDGADEGGQSQVLAELLNSSDDAAMVRDITPAKLDHFLHDVVERLRLIKAKHQRASNAATSGRARADAAAQKCTALQKCLRKAAAIVERIGKEGLGLTFPAHLMAANNDAGSAVEETSRHHGTLAEPEGGRGDGVSAFRRLNLRPDVEAGTSRQPVTSAATKETLRHQNGGGPTGAELNLVEALEFLATRIGNNREVRDWAVIQEETARLQAGEARWKADTASFQEAMAMLMQRLARNGQLVKQSLFLLGTDESAKDELIEEVLRREDKGSGETDTADYVERTLADLLQKYSRWAQRLQQATEDHLYTQRKIVKYFAAVRRFFTSQQQSNTTAPSVPEDIPEDNLYDIDSCLMRAADIILPALDSAIQAAAQSASVVDPPADTATAAADGKVPVQSPFATSGKEDTSDSRAAQRQETLARLVRDSAAAGMGGVLPYDHRLGRLYETVTRLYIVVTSLLQVHYLCIPSAARRRSSGEIELVFDGDAEDGGFVDIDLDRLIRVSQPQTTSATASPPADVVGARFSRDIGDGGALGTPPPPPSTVAANNDVILRVTYQNMEVLQDSLKRFSVGHKMASIVLQKDMDTMQQLLAGMLEKYSEVDMENAFGQSREELRELYITLRDRGLRQKGCYFFNRVGGEGTCTWVSALGQLADGFRGVVDRLAQRTALAEESRQLTDEVVDMCALYVNWAEQQPLPPSHALSPDLMAYCVREVREAHESGADGGQAKPTNAPATKSTGTAAAYQRPPKPSRTSYPTPRDSNIEQQQQQQQQVTYQVPVEAPTTNTETGAPLQVSSFTQDCAVLKVMRHMFELAQLAVESSSAVAAQSHQQQQQQQLSEELRQLRETAGAAERHVDELRAAKQAVEQERDQAQSEAAVARAELRRWKRQQQHIQELHQQGPGAVQNDPSDQHTLATTAPARPRTAAAAVESKTVSPLPINATAVMDAATVKEVMDYMRMLSEELQAAKQQLKSGSVIVPRAVVPAPLKAAADAVRGVTRTTVPAEAAQSVTDAEERSSTDGRSRSTSSATSNSTTPEDRHCHRHHTHLRPYKELAAHLRRQYASTALAPMVVVDPVTVTYGGTKRRQPERRGHSRRSDENRSQRGCRCSSVERQVSPGDCVDCHHTRDGAPTAGDGKTDSGSVVARAPRYRTSILAPPPPTSLAVDAATAVTGSRTPRRHPSWEPSFESAAVQPCQRETASPGGDGVGRFALGASGHRYPRSLCRDEPLPIPGTVTGNGNLASAPTTARRQLERQHATPLTLKTVSESRQSSRTPPPLRGSLRSLSHPLHLTGRAPQRHHDPGRESDGTPHALPRSHHPVVRDGRYDPPDGVGETLAAAVRQIDTAVHYGSSTPRRRATQVSAPPHQRHSSTARGEVGHTERSPSSVSASPIAAEQRMNRNANLRATALRRLAEVISTTAVPTRRNNRRY